MSVGYISSGYLNYFILKKNLSSVSFSITYLWFCYKYLKSGLLSGGEWLAVLLWYPRKSLSTHFLISPQICDGVLQPLVSYFPDKLEVIRWGLPTPKVSQGCLQAEPVFYLLSWSQLSCPHLPLTLPSLLAASVPPVKNGSHHCLGRLSCLLFKCKQR